MLNYRLPMTHVGVIAAMSSLLALAPAAAETLEQLAAKVPKGTDIIWYEASPPEMGEKIVADFQKQFPGLKLRYDRVTGAQGLVARVLQESEANAVTADVATTGIDQIYALNDRKLSAAVDWSKYG